ncbi:MAG TPA: ATP-binding cassette domain-containing protein, partial [Blastocatellia bacterium]|nr:ATP-binding cassette domain-containing protein [Blastocatellia bacterium]
MPTNHHLEPADGSNGPVITFNNASLALPEGKSLVAGLRFEVSAGETLVLLGRSGSGKTTTLKLINKLLTPTSGEVLVEGKSTTAWDPIRLRRHIGYVIQEIGLFPHFTVEKNVAVVPELEKWPDAKVKARVREVLEVVG